MIELIDDVWALQEQSARANFTLGNGSPGAKWARRMVVYEALLKFLNYCNANQERAEEILKEAGQ